MNFSKKFGNLKLLIRCCLRAFLYGRADTVPTSISRIIIIPDGKLGDVVCGTPVLAAVRNNFPKAHTIIGGNPPLHKVLLAESGLADEYLELDSNRDAVEQIKTYRADIALITGPSFEVAALLYLSGIPLVIAPKITAGYSPLQTRAYRVLQRFITTFPYRMRAYAPRERLRVLEPLGIIENDTTKHLGFSTTAGTKIQQFLAANGINSKEDRIVGVSPSAGHKIKEWPEERFAAVADHVATTYGAKVLVIGGPGDRAKVEKTMMYLKPETRALAITGFNIDELKALIAALDLFISVDTGPIYIAEAFGIPTIDITGPIDEKEQPPQGPLHRNVVPPERKRPQLFVLDAHSYDRTEVLKQLESITVPMVNSEVDSLLAAINQKKL